MLIKSLKIVSFRNFKSAMLDFAEGINIFYGKNGDGKSNLLEAIFVLLLGRSPRGANDAVMVKENAGIYRLEGQVEIDGHPHIIAVAYQIGGRKRITIDKTSAKISDLFEKNTAVSALPADIEILDGPPAKRREFINIYLAQASQRYLANLSDYYKVLAQKNAHLKSANEQETPYDELLVKHGVFVMRERKNFLGAIGVIAAEHYRKISAGQELTIAYSPSVHIGDEQIDQTHIEKNFREKLFRYREREKILKTALVGPHRDEVNFEIGGFAARTHGSRGELRTAAISLKLAVFEYLKQVRKVAPILLLDELFGELDTNRRDKLIESFGEFGQLFLTTASDVPENLSKKGRHYRIEKGIVNAE
ncbi:MAG: DNA replication and repair protein RecF [candidate division Zixibacteria bacterium]|nr:DNA replication and repair protein RecF [candidate division Zixibacteria bacterium]